MGKSGENINRRYPQAVLTMETRRKLNYIYQYMKQWTPAIMYKPEEIVITGGGINGCLTALYASLVRKNGRPKYHVTLLEKEPMLFNKTSKIASRLHLGGEYPLDLPTGLDCLKGGLILRMVMPPSIYSDPHPMKFTVAPETEREGIHIEAEEPGNDKYLTVEKYQAFYDKILEKYKEFFEKIKASRKWPEGMTEEKKETLLAQELFGQPKKGEGKYTPYSKEAFYWPLPPSKKKAKSKHKGGFQSQEPGFDTTVYLSFIEEALMKQQPNIDIKYGCTTLGATKLENGNFRVEYLSQLGERRSCEASQVVDAAWDGNPKLTGLKEGESIKMYRRAMLLLDVSKCPLARLNPEFRMLNEYGAMSSPFNMYIGIGYKPGVIHEDSRQEVRYGPEGGSYMGYKNVTADNLDPPDWNDSDPDKAQRIKVIFESLVKKHPFLKKATPKELLIANTLNFNDEIEKRRHQRTQEVTDLKGNRIPGHLVEYAAKATLGPQSAIEAVEMLKARSKLREEGRGNDPLPPLDDPLDLVLKSDAYSLQPSNIIPEPDYAKAKAFAIKRNLPESMSEQHTKDAKLRAPHHRPTKSANPPQEKKINMPPLKKSLGLTLSADTGIELEMVNPPPAEIFLSLSPEARQALLGTIDTIPPVEWKKFAEAFDRAGLKLPEGMELRTYLSAFSRDNPGDQSSGVPGYFQVAQSLKTGEPNIIALALPMLFKHLPPARQDKVTQEIYRLSIRPDTPPLPRP